MAYLADVAQVDVSSATQGVDMLPHAKGRIQQSANVPQSLSRFNLLVADLTVGEVHLEAVVMGADDHYFCL